MTLTFPSPRRYGSRPLRTLAPSLLALALLAGCGESVGTARPSPNRIFFPTGLTVAPRPGGGGDLLYVVNSNFQLEYSAEDGGSVVVIDPEASVTPEGGGVAPAAVLGAVRIPSYGGEIAIAHAGLPGCEGLPAPVAIVPVRYSNEIFAFDVEPDGTLRCGEGCRLRSDSLATDPYGATVACRAAADGVRYSAFVTHLSALAVDGAPAGEGFVTEIDLVTKTAGTPFNLGAGPTSHVLFDSARGLVFASPAVGSAGYAPIRWWRPTALGDTGVFSYASSDVNAYIPSSLVRGMALSSDHERLYLSVDAYDAVLASYTGGIRVTGSLLLVLDINTSVLGEAALRPARAVPMGIGLGPVAVVPRPGKRDLVVVPDTTGNEVHLYDDEAGALVTSFGRDELGRPYIQEPYAVAPQALPGGAWRVWVSSFRDGTLTAIDIDDPNVPGAARIGKRIGSSE